VIERPFDWLQNEQIKASYISGVLVIRHPFLDNDVTNIKGESDAHMNFKGIHMIFTHNAATALIQVFQDSLLMPDATTGNYRLIQTIKWGKGIVYGDLVKLVKEPSTTDKPLPFETALVGNRDHYNSSFGFKDLGLKIPDSVENLQNGYVELDDELDNNIEPNWSYMRIPREWSLTRFYNGNQAVKVEGNNFKYDGAKYYFADEEWANEEGGMVRFGRDNKRCCNNFEFKQANLDGKGITNFTILTKVVTGYTYAVKLYWEETNNFRPLVDLK